MKPDGLILADEILMCHKKGDSVVTIETGTTVKIAALPSCPNERKIRQRSLKSKTLDKNKENK